MLDKPIREKQRDAIDEIRRIFRPFERAARLFVEQLVHLEVSGIVCLAKFPDCIAFPNLASTSYQKCLVRRRLPHSKLFGDFPSQHNAPIDKNR